MSSNQRGWINLGNWKARYLGDIYTKKELVDIIVELKNRINYIKLIITFWEDNSCPDCGAPIKTVNYINKCSVLPNEHLLGDGEFYLRKIKERLEK